MDVTLLAFVIGCVSLGSVSFADPPASRLHMTPDLPEAYFLQGDPLRISCTLIYAHFRSPGDNAVLPSFFRDGQEILDTSTAVKVYEVGVASWVNSSLTIFSKEARPEHSGNYSCTTPLFHMDAQISVHVVEVTATNAELPATESVPHLDLKYRLYNYPTTDYSVSATCTDADGNAIGQHGSHGHRYRVGKALPDIVLRIASPTIRDAGAYQCSVQFESFYLDYSSLPRKFTFNLMPVYLYAGPKVVLRESQITVQGGDPLEVECDVTGYPLPDVIWRKNERELVVDDRVHLSEFRDVANSRLLITSLTSVDAAEYTCQAVNSVRPFQNSASVNVHVQLESTTQPTKPTIGTRTNTGRSYPHDRIRKLEKKVDRLIKMFESTTKGNNDNAAYTCQMEMAKILSVMDTIKDTVKDGFITTFTELAEIKEFRKRHSDNR
ncbi:uncharacterized protein LOC128239051 [Mya arenaria]|uniref:uncharacterized protein LOC128239051 n=1 Tax=Mya arenaria TaxID=6604 RepID=UPI0022DEB2A9|nr:uncharacterized protein LOC128239051 [Mya arenaria]